MEILQDNPRLKLERLELGRWSTNAYVITCQQTGRSALVDVPDAAIIDQMRGRQLEAILITHGHFDHTEGLAAFAAAIDVPVLAHAADKDWLPVEVDKYLNDGNVLEIGNLRISVLHTPGHTAGSVCFRLDNILIAGDTIFPGGPGKTETAEDFQLVLRTLREKIFALPDNSLIYPGHGSSSNIGREREQFVLFSSRPHDPQLHGDVTWLNS
jgi:glyoxylase-like metal-dependent hydrolase (beta-lactamase superfamily II)